MEVCVLEVYNWNCTKKKCCSGSKKKDRMANPFNTKIQIFVSKKFLNAIIEKLYKSLISWHFNNEIISHTISYIFSNCKY